MVRAAAVIAAAAVIIVATAAIYFQLNFQNGHVSGNSMSPTMQNGDRMVSQRWGKEIENGTIVILKLPHSEHELVKRVVALPGWTVLPPLADQTTKLGPDQYWVLGDNMSLSKDSRHFGPVTRDHITGVVIHIKQMN